jgi:hypothetical protein
MSKEYNIENLPQWAQKHIAHLERQIADLTDHVKELAEPESIQDTDTVVHEWRHPDTKLPKGSLIRFTVGTDWLDVNVNQDKLEVRSHHGGLTIFPRVGNVIEIQGKEW